MDYKHISQLLEKYLDGVSTIAEENVLKKFFMHTENIPHELQYAAGMFLAFSKEKQKKAPSLKNKTPYKWLSVAASIIVLVGMLFLLQKPKPIISKVEINQTENPQKITLKDGNSIWLNSGAEISYVLSKKSDYNMISIEGEAYFEFTNTQKKYKILAHNAVIDVDSNTRFNVKMSDSDENINFTVASGAIKVLESSTDKGLTLLVTAGNYCSVHKTLKLVFSSTNNNPNYLAWKTGEFVFENIPMATVTDVLAEYYQVAFDFKDQKIANCPVTGTFKNKSIYNIISQIQSEMPCRIISDGDVFTISGNSCVN